jgi:excinuclease UvrABC nuclease subunit
MNLRTSMVFICFCSSEAVNDLLKEIQKETQEEASEDPEFDTRIAGRRNCKYYTMTKEHNIVRGGERDSGPRNSFYPQAPMPYA